MRLFSFFLFISSFLIGTSAEAQFDESGVKLKSGTYEAATLCRAKIRQLNRVVFVTPSQCQRGINGYRFELHEVSKGLYEGQGMQLEIWDDHTVRMLANGEFLMQKL